jgi:hypothetical protein
MKRRKYCATRLHRAEWRDVIQGALGFASWKEYDKMMIWIAGCRFRTQDVLAVVAKHI